MNPLISVVIPVYNQQDFVSEAINSMLAQSVTDIEVIVIDDGSPDHSGEIAESIVDSRLVVVHQANAGPSAAANAGIERARGEFIALLGGDDVAEPNRLQEQLSVARTRGADLIFTLPAIIDDAGTMLSDAVFPAFKRPVATTPEAIFRRLVIEGNFLCAPSVLMRRQLVTDLGAFRGDLVQLQDYDYWLRAAARRARFVIMDARLTRYRRHGNNLSGQQGDIVVLAELMICILEALVTAPADLLADAFPEVLPPGQASLTHFDRCVIGLMHPRMASLASMSLMDHFLSCRPVISATTIPLSRLGLMLSSLHDPNRFTLAPEIRQSDLNSLKKVLLHPCHRDLENFE